MVALRIQSMGANYAMPFWFSALCAAVMPTSIGYQDLTAFLANRPAIAQRGADHLITSPFGAIETTTFSYSRPIGTAMPEPLGFQTVNFDPRSLDVKTWSIDRPLTASPAKRVAYPTVNRQHKGDRLPAAETPASSGKGASMPQLQPIDAPSGTKQPVQPVQKSAPPAAPSTAPARLKSADQPVTAPVVSQRDAATPAAQAALTAQDDATKVVSASPPAADNDVPNTASAVQALAGPRQDETPNIAKTQAASPEEKDNAGGSEANDDIDLTDKPPEIPTAGMADAAEAPASLASMSFLDEDPAERSAQIYFGSGVLGAPKGLQEWTPGAEPILVPASVEFRHQAFGPRRNCRGRRRRRRNRGRQG